MTARVLVVDDILANVKLLEARLRAEYFEVLTATGGLEAIDICRGTDCDIVLLDVMMPGLDGFETCRRLKADPMTAHIPVVMITALDQPRDRVTGLEAGADDFLTKPVNDVALLTRVKNLTRLKRMADELRSRASAKHTLSPEHSDSLSLPVDGGRIALVDDRVSSSERLTKHLGKRFTVDVYADPHAAIFSITERPCDLIMISLSLADFDALRLASQLQNLEATRNTPILALADTDNEKRLLRGLEIGVHDYLMRPVDVNEMMARVATQVRRKRYTDMLRQSVEQTMEMAIMDGLTGLYNRRYFDTQFRTLVSQAAGRHQNLSLVLCDIDFFKSVNDTHGHDVGDDVLREFGDRMRRSIRGADLACRYGGEEFVLVLPDTEPQIALAIAERLRLKMEQTPVAVAGGTKTLNITISMGVAHVHGDNDSAEDMIRRADRALYEAKRQGRNRVMMAA